MVIRFASNKNNNQKVVEEQALCRGTNCYVKIFLYGLKVSAICTVQQNPNAVFFNHFSAGEPSVNVCVAHGTLCSDPSVYIATAAQNCGREFRPRTFPSVAAEPPADTRGTSVVEHSPNVIKFHEVKLRSV